MPRSPSLPANAGSTTTLFVYGTLQRGDVRHHHLSGAEFRGPALTAPRYRLLSVGDAYPALVEGGRAHGVAVRGERWAVDAACLARLDEVEGVDEGLYARRGVELAEPFDDEDHARDADGGGRVEAYFWLGSTAGLRDLGGAWVPRRG